MISNVALLYFAAFVPGCIFNFLIKEEYKPVSVILSKLPFFFFFLIKTPSPTTPGAGVSRYRRRNKDPLKTKKSVIPSLCLAGCETYDSKSLFVCWGVCLCVCGEGCGGLGDGVVALETVQSR